MSDIAKRIHDLGLLHDCRITSIEVLLQEKVVRIHIADVLACIRDTEKKADLVPGTLEFTGVFGMVIAGEPEDWIGEVQVDQVQRGYAALILLTSGNRINVHSVGLAFIHDPIPDDLEELHRQSLEATHVRHSGSHTQDR